MSNLSSWNVIKTKIEKKEEYIPDTRIEKIYKAKRKYAQERRQAKFQEWLNSYTESNVSIREIMTHLCKEVFDTVNKSGYAITNEKRLRDEIASFVYKECSNHA
tara:strand:+ start:218 stop:529 length:312 start_codon:yes stop_codon:yes gene_type:complete